MIIKIGTNCIIEKDYKINHSVLKNIINQIAKLKKNGYQVLLVSSGAVGFGRIHMKVPNDEIISSDRKHVLASCGQIYMMKEYSRYCKKYNIVPCQFLLTKHDIEDSIILDNIKNTLLQTLSKSNLLPIVNENDAIAVLGMRFKDNDELTMHISNILNPDKVVFLTSIDGVYRSNKLTPDNIIRSIRMEDNINIDFFDNSNFGTGGMQNKIKMCMELAKRGITTHIYSGKARNCISNAMQKPKKYGTTFYPNKQSSNGK